MTQPLLFLHPQWLGLIPLAWLLLWWLKRHRRHGSMWDIVCEPQLLRRMTGDAARPGQGGGLYWILGLWFTLGLMAAAGPSWSLQAQAPSQQISSRVLVIELSQSMLVEDVAPDRASAALQTARDILELDFNGETGLIVYAGAAFVVSPLSRDAGTLLAFIDALDPSTMPVDGSRVDLALNLALDLLQSSIDRNAEILLIASSVGDAGAALQSAIAAARQGHGISVLAIGSPQGGPLKDTAGGLRRDERGGFIISKPDFALLQQIAEATGGGFIRTAESGIKTDLFVRETGNPEFRRERAASARDGGLRANDGYWIVWLMLPLTLLLFRKHQLWILLVIVVAPLQQPARADGRETFWRHREHVAYEAFTRGDYAEALRLGKDPLLRGNALYRQGLYRQALDAFSEGNSASAHYNRGNALVQLQQYAEAVLAYDQALKLDPAHQASAYNRSLLEYYLQQKADAAPAGESGSQDDSDAGAPEPDQAQTRIGLAGEAATNPGEDSDAGSGLGVSIDPGRIDLGDHYDGSERPLERLLLTEDDADTRRREQIEAWIETLPQSSSDLYRRKFLRDYRRQSGQER